MLLNCTLNKMVTKGKFYIINVYHNFKNSYVTKLNPGLKVLSISFSIIHNFNNTWQGDKSSKTNSSL